MENRYKLPPGVQKRYLMEVEKRSHLTKDQLASLFGIVSRSYRDWRREKFAIPKKAVEIIEKRYNVQFPYSKKIAEKIWINMKLEAARKGGINLFQKHGSPATLEGCRKGGIKSIANLKKNGIIPSYRIYDVPQKYSEDLAEYIGIMLGDGGLTSGQSAITLNSIADREYINFVSRLANKLFREAPKYFKKKDCNAITLYYNGAFLVKYFVNLGLKVGNKVKQQVDVPEWIKHVREYRIACLRGLMDTDGGVFLYKYNIHGKKYIYKKICFSNRSIPLLFFASRVLRELDLSPKIIDKVENKKVWLYNANEVKHYLNTVGTHNPRLLKHELGGVR